MLYLIENIWVSSWGCNRKLESEYLSLVVYRKLMQSFGQVVVILELGCVDIGRVRCRREILLHLPMTIQSFETLPVRCLLHEISQSQRTVGPRV
jgi:hypothetical protein